MRGRRYFPEPLHPVLIHLAISAMETSKTRLSTSEPMRETAVSPVEVNSLPEIPGIPEAVIVQYFHTVNAGQYAATVALFAEDGVMNPPFEGNITGREAILAYLRAEAKGMTLNPKEGIMQSLAEGYLEAQVGGRVQTPLFEVNVSWQFVLNPQRQIAKVTIKLLAEPQELLNLRR